MTPRDPGLQPERTALAWHRTAVALGVNALLMARSGMQSGSAPMLGGGALVLVLSVLLGGIGWFRATRLAGPPSARAERAITAAACAIVVIAVGLALWGMLDEAGQARERAGQSVSASAAPWRRL